uniref:Uncharacterized protein n=1 Tax=Tetranychus urticae TaxID=32264 RepID=T1KMW5_TETUR
MMRMNEHHNISNNSPKAQSTLIFTYTNTQMNSK